MKIPESKAGVVMLLLSFLCLFAALIFVFLDPLATSVRAEEIMGYDISIQMSNKHPFLVDHSRKLIIKKNNRKITEQSLYQDSGSRVPLSVFIDGKNIIFIDCNGYWYELDSTNDKFKTIDWLWQKGLPNNYIGTFRLRKGENQTSFLKEKIITTATVYLFKDP